MTGRKISGGPLAGLLMALGFLILGAGDGQAQINDRVVGQIEWGLWIDRDGCMHWWADGGTEGYMVPRRNPKDGRAICMKVRNCLIESTDTLFEGGGARLTASGRERLAAFFRSVDADGFGIYAHSDSSAGKRSRERETEAQARAVGAIARSMGLWVEQEAGIGLSRPVASNSTAGGRAENRRLVIACYNW